MNEPKFSLGTLFHQITFQVSSCHKASWFPIPLLSLAKNHPVKGPRSNRTVGQQTRVVRLVSQVLSLGKAKPNTLQGKSSV